MNSAGSSLAKIDFNIVGIPQDNDQASYKILLTIQLLEVCRQMMTNEDKNYYKLTSNYPSTSTYKRGLMGGGGL